MAHLGKCGDRLLSVSRPAGIGRPRHPGRQALQASDKPCPILAGPSQNQRKRWATDTKKAPCGAFERDEGLP
ncbi:hypothetical protein KBAD10_30270 [Aeromonas dhakensis]|nr:hypothetical protein KBAD10_30270 [Aeromonas dhakensis]